MTLTYEERTFSVAVACGFASSWSSMPPDDSIRHAIAEIKRLFGVEWLDGEKVFGPTKESLAQKFGKPPS